MSEIESLIVEWYKLRRLYFENDHDKEYLPDLYKVEISMEKFAIKKMLSSEYKRKKLI